MSSNAATASTTGGATSATRSGVSNAATASTTGGAISATGSGVSNTGAGVSNAGAAGGAATTGGSSAYDDGASSSGPGQDPARRAAARLAPADARGLARPVQGVCSPCTLAPLRANTRDGSWAAGFTAERDLVLDHIRERVRGRTLFVTGDTHWTMVYDRDGLFEARPCPLGIPTPNDITLTQPQAAEDAQKVPGVVYADDDRGHFALLEVSGDGHVRATGPDLRARGRPNAIQQAFRLPAQRGIAVTPPGRQPGARWPPGRASRTSAGPGRPSA